MSDDTLEFKDMFEFLAVELKRPAQELRELAFSGERGIDQLVAQLAGKDMDGNELMLAAPITQAQNDVPLVAAGTKLTEQKIRALLSRQIADREVGIGPVALDFGEKTLNRYRSGIRSHFCELAEHLMATATGASRQVHRAIAADPKLRDIESRFSEVLDTLVASPKSVSTIVRLLPDEASGTFAKSVDVSIVCMAVHMLRAFAAHDVAPRSDVINLGIASLLQDVSLAIGEGEPENHAERSAELAGQMGASREVVDLIRFHHRIEDEQGRPVFRSGATLPSTQAVLVSVNVFMGEIQGSTPGKIFETVKNLNYLAHNGFVDALSVKVFARLCLPKLQALILEKADEIAEKCPKGSYNPILWPVTGGKAPTIFLCKNFDCGHRTSQVSCLATNIPFLVNGIQVAVIKKGDYFTCPPCTAALRKLYDYIQKQLEPSNA